MKSEIERAIPEYVCKRCGYTYSERTARAAQWVCMLWMGSHTCDGGLVRNARRAIGGAAGARCQGHHRQSQGGSMSDTRNEDLAPGRTVWVLAIPPSGGQRRWTGPGEIARQHEKPGWWICYVPQCVAQAYHFSEIRTTKPSAAEEARLERAQREGAR